MRIWQGTKKHSRGPHEITSGRRGKNVKHLLTPRRTGGRGLVVHFEPRNEDITLISLKTSGRIDMKGARASACLTLQLEGKEGGGVRCSIHCWGTGTGSEG